MFRKCISVVVFVLGMVAIGLVGVAQQFPTEAPTGFATPTLAQSPGSQSFSNGIAQPPGDTYTLDQPSVVRHKDCNLSSFCRARLTFSKMSEAVAVQMKGLGF